MPLGMPLSALSQLAVRPAGASGGAQVPSDPQAGHRPADRAGSGTAVRNARRPPPLGEGTAATGSMSQLMMWFGGTSWAGPQAGAGSFR